MVLGRYIKPLIKFDFVINEFTKSHRRLNCFSTYGYKCAKCGVLGSHYSITVGAYSPKKAEIEKELLNFKGNFDQFCEIFKVNPKTKLPDIHIDLICEDGLLMTIDHVKPVSKGGKDHITNLQPMCNICNTIKGNN